MLSRSLAGVVSSTTVRWREKVKVSLLQALWINASDSPGPFPPLLFSPSGQTVFMLLDEWKKKSGNFYMLRRFSPRQISKLNSLDVKKQKMTKDNIRRFCFIFFVFFFATETWAKRASTRLRGGSVSDRCWQDRPQRGNKGMCTVGVHVCLRAWVRVVAC